MANRNKAKGTMFESAVVDYLNEGLEKRDHEAHRIPLKGGVDEGDVQYRTEARRDWIWTIQCKAEQKFDLAGYVRAAEEQSKAADTDWGVAVVKAPRKNISRAYVVMSLETFRDMAKRVK